ncbi:hypothetical protein [Pseudorhodoplanes sp.]|uniref:hypothetical protein n=1 Tax=Pseudorhodoplanes sp. TaxID=1934341 RepID=UPI00391B8CB0
MEDAFLPGIPVDRVVACYAAAPGNEIASGKFLSRESSAALVANTFGWFLGRAVDLPPLVGCDDLGWPAGDVGLEVVLRFPWSGGRHPCLDAVVQTGAALIGIESKRYEPFRAKQEPHLSEAYWRPVWGDAMAGYERIRDGLLDGSTAFARLDAAQLVKHAFGLRTVVHMDKRMLGKRPVLFYLYAEPKSWPDGRPIYEADIVAHRAEIALFAAAVSGDEVAFASASYRDLLGAWSASQNESIRTHAAAVMTRFTP